MEACNEIDLFLTLVFGCDITACNSKGCYVLGIVLVLDCFCYVLHLALKHPEAPLQVSSLYWVALRKISEKEPLNCASASCSASFQRDSRDRQAQPAEDSRAREVADSGFTVPVIKIMEAKTWFRTIPRFLDVHQCSKAEMDCKGLCQAFPAAFLYRVSHHAPGEPTRR